MLSTSSLLAILVRIRRFLVQAARRGFVAQALKWLWRRLAYFWAHLPLKPRPSTRNPRTNDASSPAPCEDTMNPRKIGPSDSLEVKKQALNFNDGYIPNIDGEIVSLEDIMPSVYPHAGEGIHSAAQSSKNLEVSRSAHASTVSLRSHNRSAFSLGSQRTGTASLFSHKSGTNPYQRDPLDISVNVIPPPPQSSCENIAKTDIDSKDDLSYPPSISKPRQSQASLTLENNDTQVSVYEASGPYNDLVALSDQSIVPIMPEAVTRYEGRPIITKLVKLKNHHISPLMKKFESPYHGHSEGWDKLVHPEGACYFHNPTKRIYAEANLYDEDIYEQLKKTIDTIQAFGEEHNIKEIDDDNDNETDLVIFIKRDTNGKVSTSEYYYVDHQTRAIFFLDVFKSGNLSAWSQVYGGATSVSHLRYEIETQYWFHCQSFPHSSQLTKLKVQELRDMVLHFIGDTMTSPKCSTSPYTLEELRGILGLANDMDQNLDGMSVGTLSCLARLMYIFARARFLHFHGEPHARIDRTTSVYAQDMYRRTWLVKTLSPLLFFTPDFHLRNLQGMWVDETLHKSVFKETMDRMTDDWDRIILFATVMLNANVAVLAIQSVDNIGTPARSATQIASYVSMIFSVGGIVIGLLLSSQNRTKFRQTVDDFETYLTARRDRTHGMEVIAILYSLPNALLMWGMVSFSLALAFMCFMNSDTPTVSVVGVSSFFSLLFCAWCLYTNWETEDQWSFPEMAIRKYFDQAKANFRRPFAVRRQRPAIGGEQHELA